ncbi:ABC transporter permease [Stackebrandtia soli]|uniref:ABC transporter permease n=1 Tax=Stackebrandtia soli TaxID=1892856 RepID=UPI0039E86C33
MSSTNATPTRPKRIFPKTTGTTALWRHRNVLRVLVQRDLAVKYQSSALGYLWSLIEPMGMAGIYWFIFGVLYAKENALPDGVSYSLYIVSGMFAWMWASSAMSESTTCLTSQSTLIRTMRVPREVFPVARVFARFAEFLAGLPILIAFAIFGGGTFSWNLLVLPAAILVQAMLLTGLAFVLATINVLFRDVQRFMRLVMRVLFYAAPTIYPFAMVLEAEKVPHWVKVLYQANPFVGIIEMHHYAWIPGLGTLSWQLVVSSVATSVVVLFLGRWLFYRLEPTVLKEL